jgi:hypothetical protein
MERLTSRKNGNAYAIGCPCFEIPPKANRIIQCAIDRLATIEDILGPDYDLDRLRALMEAERALEALEAENEKLRAELERVKRENETIKQFLQNWHEGEED